MVSSELTQVFDNSGSPISATFSVELVDEKSSIIVESRGGTKGRSNYRNGEYNVGIELILERCANAHGWLTEVLLDTATTRKLGLTADERRLHRDLPVDLQTVDVVALRKSICKAQRPIGKPAGTKGGNNTKRMRLFVEGLPAHPRDAASYLSRGDMSSDGERDWYKVRTDLEQVENSSISEPVKQRLVDARTGQGRFRRDVLRMEKECRVTGISSPQFLVAGHIVPFSKCDTNEEKYDPCNGLMFSPNVDRLFENGYISFLENGEMITSPELSFADRTRLGLPKTLNVGSFRQEQIEYLNRHRLLHLDRLGFDLCE